MSAIPKKEEDHLNSDILAFLDAKFSNVKQDKKRKKSAQKPLQEENEPTKQSKAQRKAQ